MSLNGMERFGLPHPTRPDPGVYLGSIVRRIPTQSATEFVAQMVRAVVWIMTFGRSGCWPFVRVHSPAEEAKLRAVHGIKSMKGATP